jgi:hypothetical protein
VVQQGDWHDLVAKLDRLARVQLPVALVSLVATLLTLLHICLLDYHIYIPFQVPIYAIAWARGVLFVQVLKVSL